MSFTHSDDKNTAGLKLAKKESSFANICQYKLAIFLFFTFLSMKYQKPRSIHSIYSFKGRRPYSTCHTYRIYAYKDFYPPTQYLNEKVWQYEKGVCQNSKVDFPDFSLIFPWFLSLFPWSFIIKNIANISGRTHLRWVRPGKILHFWELKELKLQHFGEWQDLLKNIPNFPDFSMILP